MNYGMIRSNAKKWCENATLTSTTATSRISLNWVSVWMHLVLSSEMRYETERQRHKQQCICHIVLPIVPSLMFWIWKKNSIMQLWLYPPFPCIRFNKFSFHNSFPHYGGVVWKSTNLDVVSFVNDCARYLFYGSRAPQWIRTYLLFQFVYLVVVFHFSNRCK